MSEGASAFLSTEYKYVTFAVIPFALFIFALLGAGDGFTWRWGDDGRAPKVAAGVFSAVAFLLGACTSILSARSPRARAPSPHRRAIGSVTMRRRRAAPARCAGLRGHEDRHVRQRPRGA